MWSVWPELIEIYLGQSMALLMPNKQERQAIRFPHGLPIEEVLENLSRALATADAPTKLARPKRRRLKVTLSAALCPPTGFSPPQGVTRWEELRRVAGATAAAGLAANPESLICEIDDQGLSLAATLPERLVSELKRWASQERLNLESVRPLWAIASQCQLAREARFKALMVHEPDAISLIAIEGDKQAVAMTIPRRIGVELEPAVIQAHTRRWMMSHGLRQDQLLTLRFGEPAHPPLARGPQTWIKHWTSP